MMAGGAGVARWAGHLACGAVAATVAATLAASRRPRERTVTVASAVAVAAIALTLLVPGLDGVRRWLVLGPLRVHASALLAPALIAVAALDAAPGRVHGLTLLAALQIVHLLQPDAGQATAVAAAGAAIVLLPSPARGATAAALGVACVALGAAAWLRADPLLPVAFVEDVVARAVALSPAAGVLCVLALACVLVAPLIVARRSRGDASVVTAGAALSAGFAGAITASALGAFPVPLLGFSPSAVLGALVGIGALLAASRSTIRTSGDRARGAGARARRRQP
jgi:hypothetical protein